MTNPKEVQVLRGKSVHLFAKASCEALLFEFNKIILAQQVLFYVYYINNPWSYSTPLSGLKIRAQLTEISLALELSQLSLHSGAEPQTPGFVMLL